MEDYQTKFKMEDDQNKLISKLSKCNKNKKQQLKFY